MFDYITLTVQKRKTFNVMLDQVLKHPDSMHLGLTLMARRFCEAAERGERDPEKLRQAIVGVETSPGDPGWPPAKPTS